MVFLFDAILLIVSIKFFLFVAKKGAINNIKISEGRTKNKNEVATIMYNKLLLLNEVNNVFM
jgi:hypothetical protein